MSELKIGVVVELDPSSLVFNKLNRIPDEKHVAKLKNAIKVRNLLHLKPIEINTKYDIIDGQHRTLAAIELGFKTVPCLVVSGSIHDAQELNQNQKNWSAKDFAHYWSKQGKAEYSEYLEFVGITGLQPSVAHEILDPTHNRPSFRQGTFKIKSLKFSYLFVDQLEGFKEALHDYRSSPFVRAFFSVFKNGKYDHKRMMHKLGLVGIKKASTRERYIEQLDEIYNYKVKAEEKVRFI